MKKVEKGNIESKWYVEVDPGTGAILGEPIQVAEQTQTVPRGGFEIAYMAALFEVFDKLGGKRYKILEYILKHKDGLNCLNMSNSELAKECDVSRTTVVDTMKILTSAGIVVRHGTVIRLSARFFVKGDSRKEAYIMRKFTEEKENSNIPGQLSLLPDGSLSA